MPTTLTTRLRRLVAILAALILMGALFSGSPARAQGLPSAHLITGVDLHDGTLVERDGTFYFYGTKYGCGFAWGIPSTHWCGFGVSTAPSLDGPWSAVTTLVAPSEMDTWTGLTWDQTCMRGGGAGCFNPRMVQRASDGVWILWFNAPGDYATSGANAYYAMGCNGPAGPCGPGKPPYGGLYKPALYVCSHNGDFSIITDGPTAYIACTMWNQTLAIEKLDQWWVNGTGQGVTTVAGFDQAEAPGAYFDPNISKWVMTLNYRNCGYGAGCGLAYATAPTMLGPWSAPFTAGMTTDTKSRAVLSANSCGGQPRTVTVLDGIAYQVIDLWDGARNQTSAPTLLTPLVVDDMVTQRPWHPFRDIQCK